MGPPPQRRRVDPIVVIVVVVVLFVVLWLVWEIYGRTWLRREHRSTITCSRLKKERLGNQLFIVAATIGVAHANKSEVVLPPETRELSIGQLCGLEETRIGRVRPQVTVKERKEGFFTHIQVPPDGRAYDLDGYFQSHLYSERSISAVRQALRPRRELVDDAVAKVPECAAPNAIGLHVRRGDYLGLYDVDKYSHCLPGYYRDAVALLRKRHGQDAPVVVCSDDLPWCRRHLKLAEPLVFADTGSALGDFCVLYRCAHAVIANSSFSWWAAHLKEDEGASVIAPHPWYQKNGILAHLNSDELYAPGWTILDARGSVPYVPKHIANLVDLARSRQGTRVPKAPEGDEPIGHASAVEEVAEEPAETSAEQRALYGLACVVSLDTASERWESAKEVLARAGLTATRFRAVDKHVIAELGGREGLKELGLIAEDDRDLDSEGTIGCGLSHMAAWALALERGEDRVTMFEDDVASYIAKTELDRRVRAALDAVGASWDVLYLGKCSDACGQYVKVIEGVYQTRRPYCTHGYMISASGMRKLLARPLYTGIDTQIIHAVESDYVKAYVLHPSVFVQDIVRWSSSLRSFKLQIGNQNDCAFLP
jgi:hypothetical protein